MFCPTDQGVVLSAGDKDGIYIWSFYGDTQTQFGHQSLEENPTKSQQQPNMLLSKSQSVLEKLRTTKKEAKQQSQLKEDTFILPQFKPLESLDLQQIDIEGTQEVSQTHIKQRKERQLTYNHYANSGNTYDVEIQPQLLMDDESQEKQIMPSIVNGYDGFGGVHDNLCWNQQEGWMVYTLHNKVIFENFKTREQKILIDSTTQLSTCVLSNDKKFLAVAEGKPNKSGNSLIYLYDCEQRALMQKYTFHQRGVQTLAFSNNNEYLISIGVQGENNLAIWDLKSGLVVKSCLIKNTNAVNSIKVDPYIEDQHIQFTIVGNQGLFNIYRFEAASQQLQTYEVDNLPQDFLTTDFTSIAFTQFFGAPYNTYLIMLGASDGSMTAYDQKFNQFVDNGIKKWCISGEIGHIRSANQSIVIASSTGTIARYSTQLGLVFPQDSKQVQILKADSAVQSMSLDDLNNEGIVGTANGAIYYINFSEKQIIRIVGKGYHLQKEISILKFSEQNPQLFLSNCSELGSTVKLWTSQSVDQVIKFNSPTQSPVAFIISSTNQGRYSVIGHQSGLIRLLQVETLKIESQYQIRLEGKDEIITTAVFNNNGINLAIGTSQGNLYLGSIRDDPNGKPKATFGKLEGFSKGNSSISSLQFSSFDPLGSLLVAFDNGVIKTWQSSVRNEQFMKLMEIQQQQQLMGQDAQVPIFDLSECGYQQFDLIDSFDMFENPHGLDELGEDEKAQLKLLYQNKRYKQCEGRFSPGKTSVDIYFSFVSALQYIYLRNYAQGSIVKRVSLMNFPTCFTLIDFNSLFISDDELRPQLGGEQVIAFVGCKEGKVLIFKISSSSNQKLGETKAGLSYGGITAIDVQSSQDKLIASSESGELFTIDILTNIENHK